LIEPIQWAGASFAANHHVDIEFLGVHERSGWGKPHPYSLRQSERGSTPRAKTGEGA
jgi:hypothetical protein